MNLPRSLFVLAPFLVPACVDSSVDSGGTAAGLPDRGNAHIWTPHGVLEVAYTRDGDRVVFQDDMTMRDEDFAAAIVSDEDLSAIEAGEPNLERAAVRAAGRYRWPGGVIPFQWGPGVTVAQRDRMQQAIDEWNDNTSIQFVERDGESNFVELRTGDPAVTSCRADVGRLGGEQEVRMNGCSWGNLAHELGHTVGFYHEHCRYDRDSYVTINWDNVADDRVTDFQRYVERVDNQTGEERDGTDAGPYDYGSIMHYGTNTGSNGNGPAITPPAGVSIGQRNGLSTGDVLAANALVYPGGIANDKIKVALYANSSYGGASVTLGKGYHAWSEFGGIGDNNVSSMIIPKGLAVQAWSAGVDDAKKYFGTNQSTMPTGWDNTISAVIVSRGVRVYRDANQTGIAQGFPVGTWKANAGQLDIIGNDTISSLYVPPGLVVELCTSEDGASCQTYDGGNINSIGTMDNKASMIRVKAAVTVYQEGNLWGTNKSFPIGTYNGSFAPVVANSISSIIVGDGLKATLCDYTDGTGNCAVFRGDVNFIGGALNDRVSYIKVEANTAP